MTIDLCPMCVMREQNDSGFCAVCEAERVFRRYSDAASADEQDQMRRNDADLIRCRRRYEGEGAA